MIAHPARYKLTANEEYALFSEFKAHGGRGVEVVTGSHTAAEYVKYADTAREFGLAASRGSDFHSPDESHTDLGLLPFLPGGLTRSGTAGRPDPVSSETAACRCAPARPGGHRAGGGRQRLLRGAGHHHQVRERLGAAADGPVVPLHVPGRGHRGGRAAVARPLGLAHAAHRPWHPLRGVLLLTSILLAFLSLRYMPVGEFTAIVMITPLAITLLAATLLKEQVSPALAAGGGRLRRHADHHPPGRQQLRLGEPAADRAGGQQLPGSRCSRASWHAPRTR